MRDIAFIITMADDTIISIGMCVDDNIAQRMEASEEIKLRVMVKPIENGNIER